MDNSQSELKGNLFSSIGYKSDKDLRNLIDNLTYEQSLIFINKSLEFAYSQGIFSMNETEIISKSLSIVNSLTFNSEPKK